MSSRTQLCNLAAKATDALAVLRTALNERLDSLEQEQSENEAERKAWDAEGGKPEPEEIDNQGEIDELTEDLGACEQALDELAVMSFVVDGA